MTPALLLAILAAAPALPERIVPGNLRVEKLPNGLTVALVPFGSNGVVALDTLIRAGSRDEQGASGVAHLVEHLLFKGTAQIPEAELKQRLQALGVDANGETDHDYTLFADVGPSSSLSALIDIEADRFEHARITSEAVATEAGSVRSEAEARAGDPEVRLGWALDAVAFPHHPYGRQPIGTAEDLRNLHAATEAARAFLAQHYRPDATLIVIAGDFEPDQALARVTRAFRGWKGHATADVVPNVEAPKGEVHAELRIAGAPPVEIVGFRVSPPKNAREAASGLVTAELLAGPLSALHRQLVLERDVADRVGANAIRRRDPALFTVTLVAQRAAELGELDRALDTELRALRSGKIDAEQLELVRSALLWGAVARLDTPARVARELAIESAATGDASALVKLFAEITQLDAASLLDFAQLNLDPARRGVAVLGDVAKVNP